MHASVLPAFLKISRDFEGEVSSLYVDIKNLVTTAIGCLSDPVSMATGLPFYHEATGLPASPAEISTAWHQLKNHPGLSVNGKIVPLAKLHWKYAARLNDLRLSQKGIDDLVLGRLRANESIIKKTFPEFDGFSADAQLAIFSVSWAVGAAFHTKFPNLANAIRNKDWTSAIVSSKIREDNNPGVRPRNAANRLCFANAAIVERLQLDVSQLFWPNVASAPDDTTADPHTVGLQQAARVALTFASDVVGMAGANLRDYEAAEADDDGTDPAPNVA